MVAPFYLHFFWPQIGAAGQDALHFAFSDVAVDHIHCNGADLLCGCAGRRQKRVEHAFLSELHPYLAPKAGGWTLVDGDGERAADVFLAPIGREILIEIVAQHGYRAVYDNAAQRKIGRASCRERVFSTCRSRWSPYH